MSRGLWFAAGAGAGIYAMVRGRRAAEVLTYDGLHDRLGALAVGARLFRDEVAQGRAEAEDAVRARLGASSPPQISSPPDTPELAHRQQRGTP
ncbi:MAG: DUF6167 family protein [Nocardioides sp.]|uniref:Unannotated protein n=1 Tax=freshwater metagenome TaxID=449393 RepID=A0A6J6TRM9_9ZZZZ|nr:DUF6167 family protein [Nocardioides sp.]